jgi:hypothetical protein
MTHRPQAPDDGDLHDGDEIDELLSRANPNPDRVGCPPRATLLALSRRARPIEDPGYEHLVKCSPCYREFRALQSQGFVGFPSDASARPALRVWIVAAAAVLLVALVSVWWLTREETGMTGPSTASIATNAPVQAQLDLRKFSVTRSQDTAPEPAPVELPSRVVDVTLLLPVGSEPGSYDVQILDGDLKSRGGATGTAAIADFITTLRVRLNLQQIAPGPYQLAVRRHGDSWRMFPAVVVP